MQAIPRPTRPILKGGLVRVLALLSLAVLALPGPGSALAQVVNEPPAPPQQILAFPQRDFLSASGYLETDLVKVELIHANGTTFTTDPPLVAPQADPRAAVGAPFAGIVEVNHPGGACWAGTTPDIHAGDVVRLTAFLPNGTIRTVDQTTVADVRAAAPPVQVSPNTIQVHGSARDALGNPLPLGQLDQRLIANKDLFDINGRRVLSSSKEGTLAYDPVDSVSNPAGVNWTATYTGLDPADMVRALGAEVRILWLGRDPLAATEGTIFESGAGVIPGPAAPCTAPLEKLPPPPGSDVTAPTAPTLLSATVSNANSVVLNWSAATDNVGVTGYGVYRDGVPLFNVAGNTLTYTDVNVPPGTFTYTVDAADAAGNRSALSNAISATTAAQTATLPAGVVPNEPPVAPVQLIPFPQRDFVSNMGYLANDTVNVQLIRNGFLISTASGVIPQADPRAAVGAPFAGIVEVNHPGGACWEGVTPDIRAGDILRLIAFRPDGTIRTVDQTTTSYVLAQRPFVVHPATPGLNDGVVAVHGIAMDTNGDPIPVLQVEARFIANRDLFDFNGRRTLRAGGAGKDGAFVYDAGDPTGVHWTATYSGLDENDVARVVGGTTSTGQTFAGAQSRALWLGVQPAAGLELTISETDAITVNGPTAPCTTPAEPPDTIAPSTPLLQATQSGPNDVQLSWSPATDNVAVHDYGIYQDGRLIKFVGAAATSFVIHGVALGPHTYQIDASDAASPARQGFGDPYGNRSPRSASVALTQSVLFDLTVSRAGAGVGTVASTSNPAQAAQIACGATCGPVSYPSGAVVTLTATADAGSVFAGWAAPGAGTCAGTTNPCSVTMSQAQALIATFNTAPPVTFGLTVTKSGAGAGTVTSTSLPAQATQINCGLGAGCGPISYPSGTVVTLTAAADPGSTFVGWTGAVGGTCTGTTNPCTVTMSQAQGITATFDIVTFGLTVAKSGTGAGTVTSTSVPAQAAQVNCGATCGPVSYPSGAVVTLTAAPAAGSTFGGWTGAVGGTCAATTNPCTVTMSQAQSVTAAFNIAPVGGVQLLGTQAVQPTADSNPAGLAEAFQYTNAQTGTVTALSLYVDSGNTATRVVVGLYADNAGTPGALLTSGTITAPVVGQFNAVAVSSVGITAGTRYWIAVLGPAGSGIVHFRDVANGAGGLAQVSLASNLSGLPASWAGGARFTQSPMSAQALGTAVVTPPPTTFGLTVTKGGTGTGAVTSTSVPAQAAQVNCGATCGPVSYPSGAVVTLTAAPAAGSTFGGWTGAVGGTCAATTNPCTVTMSQAQSVTAAFNTAPVVPPAATTLIGDQAAAQQLSAAGMADSNPAGMAEAFRYTAAATGTVTSLSIFVDVNSTGPVIVGLYSGAGANPGTLLTQATIAAPVAGQFNTVTVPSAAVTAGTQYWIAVLGPSGVVNFRDTAAGAAGSSQVSAQTNLTALPATWTPGATFPNSPMAAFAQGN